MKHIKLLFFAALVVSVFSFSQKSQAFEFGLTAGMQTSDVESKSAGVSINGNTGFHFGVIGYSEIDGNLYVRSGAIVTQRTFDTVTSTETKEAEIYYLEVPLNLHYAFQDSIGLFAGLQFGLKISDSCDSNVSTTCDLGNVESMVYGAAVGAQFQFTPNIGVELSYLLGLSEVTDATEKLSGLAVSAKYLF